MDFIDGYVSFLLETITVLIAFAFVLRLIRGGRGGRTHEGRLS